MSPYSLIAEIYTEIKLVYRLPDQARIFTRHNITLFIKNKRLKLFPPEHAVKFLLIQNNHKNTA
ncbi:hypothetical protein D3C77_346470 [compost metagenome]